MRKIVRRGKKEGGCMTELNNTTQQVDKHDGQDKSGQKGAAHTCFQVTINILS